MFNGDPSLCSVTNLTTEQIQKYLEENKQLILAILEGQNLGKSSEIAQFQAKLQHNLTYLARLADAQPQEQIHSQPSSQSLVQQGKGKQLPHVAMSQQQPDLSTLPFDMKDQQQQQHHLAMSQQQPDLSTLPFDMKDQRQQQHHLAMSLQQPDLSTSKLPLQMNDQQHKQPTFFQQQQLIQGPTNKFPGTNGGIYQASQTRLGGINLSSKQESNQIGLDASPGGSLGKSPLGRNGGNIRP